MKKFLFLVGILLCVAIVAFAAFAPSNMAPELKIETEQRIEGAEGDWVLARVEWIWLEVIEIIEIDVVDKEFRLWATAYSPPLFREGKHTKSGQGVCWGSVAVDPKLICLGGTMRIEGFDDVVFRIEDTGRLIKGHDVDIWMPTYEQAMNWGGKWIRVWVTGKIKVPRKVLKRVPIYVLKK